MRVRLAFAVAAHLESEILLIDEVLAVGDIEFQKKCLNKMDEISTQEGRTVLFVSHNLAAIENLCSRVILLENGRITADDSPNQVIQKYTKSISQTIAEISLADRTDRTGGDIFRFTKVEFLDTKTTALICCFIRARYPCPYSLPPAECKPVGQCCYGYSFSHHRRKISVRMFKHEYREPFFFARQNRIHNLPHPKMAYYRGQIPVFVGRRTRKHIFG